MKRVLVTRPEPGATQTAARLTALGLIPIVAPVMSVAPIGFLAPKRVAATLLTSRNAIAGCPPSLYAYPVFAVGTATANEAMRAGFSQVYDAAGDATALVDLVARTLSRLPSRLFLPTGQGQGTELAASLRQRGFQVIRRVAYTVSGVPVLPEVAATHLRQRQLAAATFFSGETARHFVHLVKAAKLIETVREVEAVSISERTAVALSALPWRRMSVAPRPNQDAMLKLLK